MTAVSRAVGGDAGVCAALAALWTAFWWPIISGAERLYVADFSTFGEPTKHYWRERVGAGELPAWIPSVDAGSPFLADVGYQALYPPNLMFLLDTPVAAALSWFMALHFLAGMLGMYALARSLGAWPLLAGWAAAVYGLQGYPLGVADNITYIAGVAWAPCVLAAFIAGMRRRSPRRLVLAASLLALLLLAGDLLDAAAVLGVCAVYALHQALGRWREGDGRGAVKLLLLAGIVPVLATLLAGAQVLPTLELLPISTRAEAIAHEYRQRWSMPLLRMVEFVHPYLFGVKWPQEDFLAPSLYPGIGAPWSESIYLGPVVVGCAIAALWLRPRAAAGWAALVVLALLFSTTGNYQLLLDFTAQLPVLDRQRYFEKLVFWACIGLLALAVLGANAQLQARREPWPRGGTGRFALASTVLLGFWLTLDLAIRSVPEDRFGEASAFWSEHLPATVTHAGGSITHVLLWMPLLAGCLLLSGRWRRVLVCIALVATLSDLFWIHQGRYISAPAELVSDEHTPAAVEEILALDGDGLRTGRVFYDHAVPGNVIWLGESFILDRVTQRWAANDESDLRSYMDIYNAIFLKERITPNYGVMHGVRYLNGDWSPLRRAEILRLERELLDEDPGLLLALGGVRWVVTAAQPRNYVWEIAGFEEAAVRNDINLRLLRAPVAAPRAWLSAREDIKPPMRDYLQPAGEARVVEEAPERLRIVVDAGPDARWLVVSESLMPGWEVSLDGQPVQPEFAHRRFIGVPVQPGAHEVVMEYRVPGLVPGVLMSALGLLCALLLGVAPRLRSAGDPDARVG